MLSKTVLVKNITNLSEARYCAGMGVEYLSFDLNPDSPDFLNKKAFEEIRNWLTGVKVLGQVNVSDQGELQTLQNEYQLDGFVSGNEELLSPGRTDMFFEINVSDPFLEDKLNIYSPLVESFILIVDEADDQIITKMNQLASLFPVICGYDLDLSQIGRISNTGFAFSGSKEERPGFNNYDQLMDKLESLETE
jgi:phosphoribosylanthranilate isomerase